ncbi:MAG: helix-turn-helix domain-containing protein [Candidatus Heimdallarchaeaceae archaeon]|jgi:predicted transcriptional regulator
MYRCLVDIPENIQRSIGLRDCACEDWECDFCICPIFEFVFGLKPLHIHIYFYTLGGKRTIKEISSRIDRDRTTAVRLVQNLMKQGLVLKEQEMLPHGGLRHLYSAIPQEILKERLKETIKDVEALVDTIIQQDWSQVRDRKEEEERVEA